MERILITGSSGFIGGHLVRHALELGYEVWVALRPGAKAPANPRVKAVTFDYFSEQQMADAVAQHETDTAPAWHYVIHNAGLTKATNPQDFYTVNAEHTKRLTSALCRAKHPPKRFLLMSSLSSYGVAKNATDPMRITDEQLPNTEYGKSKKLAEEYLRASGLEYTMLLPTGVYGPGDKDYLLAIDSVVNKGMYTMTGRQPQILTFVYGGDVARAALFLITQKEAAGKPYIISDGKEYTDLEFGQLIQKLSGRERVRYLRIPLPLVRVVCMFGSLWSRLSGRTTPLNNDKYPMLAQRNWRCDASPLFALGFTPRWDLEAGLRETLDSLK